MHVMTAAIALCLAMMIVMKSTGTRSGLGMMVMMAVLAAVGLAVIIMGTARKRACEDLIVLMALTVSSGPADPKARAKHAMRPASLNFATLTFESREGG